MHSSSTYHMVSYVVVVGNSVVELGKSVYSVLWERRQRQWPGHPELLAIHPDCEVQLGPLSLSPQPDSHSLYLKSKSTLFPSVA